MPTTPVFGWPYQSRSDAPHGPNLGEQLALAIEATLGGIAGWQPWVPVLTNLTLGTGTQDARYRQVGKTVDYYWRFVFGGGSAVGTDPLFTPPVAPAGHYPVSGEAFFPGTLRLVDTGSGARQGDITLSAGPNLRLVFWTAAPALSQITATAPWTWGVGDFMTAYGTYEAA